MLSGPAHRVQRRIERGPWQIITSQRGQITVLKASHGPQPQRGEQQNEGRHATGMREDLASVQRLPMSWNTTPAERAASYPCDAYLTPPWCGVLRAVDIEAPETGRHLSGIISPPFDRLFGSLAGTYIVTPRGPHASRLVVKLTMGADGLRERIRGTALAWAT